MHSKSNMEEVFLNVFPFWRAILYIIILKTEKKPCSKHIFLTLSKQHFLNLIIHGILFSSNNY